jgi:ABC-2 type transport system ATP-binding protein
MSTTPPIIETRALTKRFGLTKALAALELSIPAGCAFGLLGRNGAGKSTLLRVLLNLTSPTRGDARVFGTVSSRLSEVDRSRIGYVAEGQDLPGWMRVGEYLAFLKPLYPNWDDAFCAHLTHTFDIPLTSRLKNLSRGQRVKAAFVGALAFRPRLLLLDEPFGGLDASVRQEVLDALLALMANGEMTILASSHEFEEVERLTDEVGILDNGKLVLREETDTLLSRCRSVSLMAAALPKSPPPTWWDLHLGEGRVTFVDSAHDAKNFASTIQSHFPDAKHLQIEPAPLKTICRAVLRQPIS